MQPALDLKRYSGPVPESQIGPLIATIYELQSSWLEPRLKKSGMRWTTFQLLATVMAAGDGASQAEVARRLGVAPATLSESVHAHVESGHLVQEPSPADRRKKILRLTPSAKKKMGEVGKHVRELESRMSRSLSGPELLDLERLLEKVVENLEAAP